MRSPNAWLAASSCVLLLAACGGGQSGPRLPHRFANVAAAQADRIAALLEDGQVCAAAPVVRRLQQESIGSINAHRVPAALQEGLLSRVNGLAEVAICGRRLAARHAAATRARALATWLRAHS